MTFKKNTIEVHSSTRPILWPAKALTLISIMIPLQFCVAMVTNVESTHMMDMDFIVSHAMEVWKMLIELKSNNNRWMLQIHEL